MVIKPLPVILCARVMSAVDDATRSNETYNILSMSGCILLKTVIDVMPVEFNKNRTN
jgi:hypothetical protein